MPLTSEESYQAPASKKGLEVLDYLSGQTEPHAVSEIARALSRSRNEIYRMVIGLEQLGYLAGTDADRFAVTRKLFDAAMRTPPQRNLIVQAMTEMEWPSMEISQRCHLTVASGTDRSSLPAWKAMMYFAFQCGSGIAASSINRPGGSCMRFKQRTGVKLGVHRRPGQKIRSAGRRSRRNWRRFARCWSFCRPASTWMQ